MTRLDASVTVQVPVDLCFHVIRDGYADPRWREAYQRFRPGREYSGIVVEEEANQRLVVSEAAVDALTGAHVRALGYQVAFAFQEEGPSTTRVEVAVEYGLVAALGAAGTMSAQAANEIMHRVSALLALETGYLAPPRAELITPP